MAHCDSWYGQKWRIFTFSTKPKTFIYYKQMISVLWKSKNSSFLIMSIVKMKPILLKLKLGIQTFTMFYNKSKSNRKLVKRHKDCFWEQKRRFNRSIWRQKVQVMSRSCVVFDLSIKKKLPWAQALSSILKIHRDFKSLVRR